MGVEIKAFRALCEAEIFTINGIRADTSDFGWHESNGVLSEWGGCKNCEFKTYKPTDEILKKYKISLDEYYMICNELSEKLSFGECGWCI